MEHIKHNFLYIYIIYFIFCCRLTTNEILDLLEGDDEDLSDLSDEDEVNVAFFPPVENAYAVTDEDSDLSDGETVGDITHLPRRILRSTGTIITEKDSESSEQCSTSKPTKAKSDAKSGRKKKKLRNWDNSTPNFLIQAPNFEKEMPEIPTESPLAFFEKFFNRDLVEHIVRETNLYSNQHGRSVNLTVEELLGILGLMVYSGYRPVHDKRNLWANEEDVSSQWAKDLMPKNRFLAILRDLHLADNYKIDKSDPYYKVRPYFQLLNEAFLKSLPLDVHLSIDEIMVPYYGRHGTKQYIRGKPIRYGYKLWALASSKGYVYNVEPYCGASTLLPNSGKGMGRDVVVGLAEKASVQQGHYLFFDNLFTSLNLLDELTEKGIGGCGTIRDNRMEGAPFTNKKSFEKTKRGTTEWKSDGQNLLVRWNDNKGVTVATNFVPLEPSFEAHRYVKAEGGRVVVTMPGPLHAYNQSMGGVDLFDQSLATYRSSMRTKKWWWPLFQWGLDAARTNAWLLSQRSARGPQLPFTRLIAKSLLKRNSIPRPPSGYRGNLLVCNDIRYDGLHHWPKELESRYHRCKQCGDRTNMSCSKCDVPLHPKCIQAYHTKQL